MKDRGRIILNLTLFSGFLIVLNLFDQSLYSFVLTIGACVFIYLSIRSAYFNVARAAYLLGVASITGIFLAASVLFSLAPIINDIISNLEKSRFCAANAANFWCSMQQFSIPTSGERWVIFVALAVTIILLNALWFARPEAEYQPRVQDIKTKDPKLTFEFDVSSEDEIEAGVAATEQSETKDASQLPGATNIPDALTIKRQAPNWLPPIPLDFVGRKGIRNELRGLLEPNNTQAIIALRGMGGIGKTTLAIVVGHDLAPTFPDGVFWLNLRSSRLSDAEDPYVQIARIIHAYDPFARIPGAKDEIEILYRALLSKLRCLIIVDDASDPSQIQPLVPPPPSSLLITSRKVFQLRERPVNTLCWERRPAVTLRSERNATA